MKNWWEALQWNNLDNLWSKKQKKRKKKERQMAISSDYLNYTGSMTATGATIAAAGVGYLPVGSAYPVTSAQYQVPWESADEWTKGDVQDAAGYGWLLAYKGSREISPELQAWFWSPKAGMTDDELIHDVIQHAMTNTPIAYKMLCILTKNRSPYSKWADTAKALAETYDS